MKKIGIITFHRAHNYGATLQCMALSDILKENAKNYEIEVVNYCNKKIDSDYALFRIDKTNYKTIIKSFASSIIYFVKNINRRKKYIKYINNHLTMSREIYEENDNIFSEYDILICGSDQIWNPKLTGKIDNIYFLNVPSNAKKISYAASLGSNKLVDNVEKYRELINGIQSISVRELDGCKKVKNLIKRDIKNVLDPTLLLNGEKWHKYVGNKLKYNDKFIFVYSPNNINEYKDVVNYISEKLSMGIINFSKKNIGFKNVIKNMYCSDPSDFLECIMKSDYVVVTSFHAVVFSILFHKKFWVISPKDNNSRVNTLLSLLGIENRSFESIEELQKIDLEENIDYKEVDKKLESLRNDSLQWLLKEIRDE